MILFKLELLKEKLKYSSALEMINEWHGVTFAPDININFYIDQANEDLILPYRIREGLKAALAVIIGSTYPLILTGLFFIHLIF